MIRFSCPACQKVFKAPSRAAGRKASCPRCGNRLLIPPPIQAPEELPADEPPGLVIPEWESPQPQRTAGPLLASLTILLGFLTVVLIIAAFKARDQQRSKHFKPELADVRPPLTTERERDKPTVPPSRLQLGERKDSPALPPGTRNQKGPLKDSGPLFGTNDDRPEQRPSPATLPHAGEYGQSFEEPHDSVPQAPPNPTSPKPFPNVARELDTQSLPPGSPVANEQIEVPGEILKELVPGYETRCIHGFTMLFSTQAIKEAKKDEGRPFRALLKEFDGLVKVLPPSTLQPLRGVLIWIEWDKEDRTSRHTLARYYGGLHLSKHLLKSNAIELLSLKNLSEEKNFSVHRRLVLLHELAHAVHYHVVGFDNPFVLFAYKQAMDRRLYERVQMEDGQFERAYAATDSREYFAELTCAYLDRCHYFPFTREDLKDHDPTGYRLMELTWGKAK
jgi:DNA-directed RNA polymerase subunit RPC12/RpoP